MDWSKNFWISYSIGVLCGIFIMYILSTPRHDQYGNPIGADTTYNKVKLDSIQVQIGKRDTIIYNLKIKLKDDIERSYQLDDTAAVQLFKQLAKSTDTIR